MLDRKHFCESNVFCRRTGETEAVITVRKIELKGAPLLGPFIMVCKNSFNNKYHSIGTVSLPTN